MTMLPRRDVALLIGAAALALAIPTVAARYASGLLRDGVEPALSTVVGEQVSIRRVEASLTGGVRMDDVRVGQVASAAAVEASIGLDSLLRGQFGADEIRIERPRLRTRIDAGGEHVLRPILHRVAAARARQGGGHGDGPRRLRRIVVTGGQFRVALEDRGAIELRDVQLYPQQGGVRFVAGAIDAELSGAGLTTRAAFDRAAADIRLPELDVTRAVAVGGEIDLAGRRGLLSGATIAFGVSAPGAITFHAETHRGRFRLDAAGNELVVRGDAIPLVPLDALAPPWLDLSHAEANGRARVRLRPGAIDLAAVGELAGARLHHDRVASEPLPIDGALELDATLTPDAVELREAVLTRGHATVRARGTASLAAADLSVELPRTSCLGALHAIPAPARRRLAGLDARGTVEATARVRYDHRRPRATRLNVDVDISDCDVTREADGADPGRLRRAFEHVYPDGSRGVVDPADSRYAHYEIIPDHVVGAFVAAEDARFFSHPGFDLHQIERSLAANVAAGELLRGGSTITQQLAKNAYLEHDRTFARKLEEVVVTWRLEDRLSKQQIVETYLNIIELGDGVFGVPAAARHWFDKKTTHLSYREAAFLAALTPAPRTLTRRLRESGRIDDDLNHRIDIVLRAMRGAGYIDDRQYRKARDEQLELRSRALARR